MAGPSPDIGAPPGAGSGTAAHLRLWANYLILVYTALALAGLLIVLNLIIFDHNVRFDLTPTKRFTLSEFDKRVLEGVHHDVKVLCFIRTEDPTYLELEDILFRAATFNPRVSYQIIDVNRAPGLARQYGISSYGEVVVESEGRRRDFDNARPDLLIPAILQVTRNLNKVIYVPAGHGERNLFDSDRNTGYSQLRTLLLQDNYQIKELALLGGAGVPDDASMVMIAGPQKDFLPDELAGLKSYLDHNGHLLVMLDPYNAPSLVNFLKLYHVDFMDQVLVDPAYRLSAGEILTTQVPLRSADNSISRSMVAPAVFSLARGLEAAGERSDAPDGLEVQRDSVFLRSSNESWASGDPKAVTVGITEYMSGRDVRGPIAEGVEVDLARPADAHKPIAQMARIVAIGDSDFCSNQFIEMLGNRDLVLNAINELAGDQTLIASRARVNQAEGAGFYVSDQQSRRAFMLGVIYEPVALFAIGMVVFIRRRFFV